jgi:hypothetical protein
VLTDLSMKMECDRDDVAFIAVSPVVRLSLPCTHVAQIEHAHALANTGKHGGERQKRKLQPSEHERAER